MGNQRQVGMKWGEVVRVNSPDFLVNGQHSACRYETRDGAPLAAGFYLAMLPSPMKTSFYGRDVKFLGPFASREAARMMHVSALEFGVVDGDTSKAPNCASLVPSSIRHAFMGMAREGQGDASAGLCVSA